MKRLIPIALLFLMTGSVFAGSPASNRPEHVTYNYDGHYWTVYLVGVLLKLPDAKELAFYAELPDHVSHEDGSEKRATMTWLNVFMQGKVHALTGKDPEKERERSRRWYAHAKTMKEKGRALHRLGDSYAHAKPCGTKMYKRGFGHAFTPEHGHAPDMIRNYPEKYLAYVKDLVQVMGGTGAQVDMTAFEYIARMKLETEDNIEILKAEIALQCKMDQCTINRNQSQTLQAYLAYRTVSHKFTSDLSDIESKSKRNLRTKVTFHFPASTEEGK